MEPKQLLEQIKARVGEATDEVTFAKYLEMVAEDPRLARLSHALISDMIEAEGISVGPDGEERFDLFEGELFGQEHVIQQVADYFRAAGRRLDVRKRILLLVGPPGSGKSTLVNTMKRGLEAYTRTDDGRVYAVQGSQMHEDPLRMIPEDLRDEAGVYIEGDLNPEVRWMLETTYKGDISRVPVERVYYSIAHGLGFGTYVATDPRSEDLTRLVGDVDLTQLNPADPSSTRRAYQFDGELNAAHRGMADLLEVFKMDERFLAVLLSLSQEQIIKTSGPGTMYADEVVIAQSNLAEYQELVGNPRAAAMLDRLVVVKVPFVLSVRDEIRIYEKMLAGADLGRRDVSPLAMHTAATFAVLTRLAHPGGGMPGLIRKLHLYDGRFGSHGGAEDAATLPREVAGGGDDRAQPAVRDQPAVPDRRRHQGMPRRSGRTRGPLGGVAAAGRVHRGRAGTMGGAARRHPGGIRRDGAARAAQVVGARLPGLRREDGPRCQGRGRPVEVGG